MLKMETDTEEQGKSTKRFPNLGDCNLEMIMLRDING